MQNSQRSTIMIADDYDEVRSILKGWLEQNSYRVIEATSGKEAVELAEREHPELILMDLAMPEIDGFGAAFLIRTRKDLRDIPIIGISAFGELGIDAQLKINPQTVGFTDYLPKPFAPQKLMDLIEKYLPRKRSDS
jgi:CheY-like chemotaxis protein